jgi:hypothetical protein
MKHEAVQSSNIESIGYDGKSNTLGVKFKGGSEYHYHGISPGQYQDLRNAQSIGAHLHTHIKGAAHTVTKL